MKLLVLDLCNYEDYPLGGQLSFARNLISSFGADARLVGITTDDVTPVGKWTKKIINGIEYDYYSVSKIVKTFKRPLIPARICSYFKLRPHIKQILTGMDFDLIFVQAPELLFCLSEKNLSKTLMIMPGVENPLFASRYPWARKLQRIYDYFFIKKAAKIKYLLASANEEEINGLITRSKGLLCRNQIIKFPTRYDSSVFYVMDKMEERRKLNVPENATIISTVGRLSWFKGWKFMIDTFKILCHSNRRVLFYFLGDGEDRSQIEEYILSLNLQNNIFLLGRKSPQEVASYLNASDTFVMGSYKEGWSTTLVEACACCVPCVTTDFSSASEMIENGINGYVVPNRSEIDFAKHIENTFDFNRDQIIKYNDKYKSLAVSLMKDSIENLIKKE